MEALPDEIVLKIFGILERDEESFWCKELRNVSQSSLRMEEIFFRMKKRYLTLGRDLNFR